MAMASPAATTSVKVIHTTDMVTVTIGERVFKIDLDRLDIDNMPENEQSVVFALLDGEHNVEHTVDLLSDDIAIIIDLRNRAGITKNVAENTVEKTESILESRTRGVDIDYVGQRIDQLKKTAKTAECGFCMLIYDIPTKKNKECPNPSILLWRHGFRLNKSCWVMPQNYEGIHAREVQRLMAHWTVHKIEQHIIPYADYANDQIKRIASNKLDEEVRRLHTAFIKALDEADEKLVEALNKEDANPHNLQTKHDNKVRSTLIRANKALESAIRCAELFDAREQVNDLLMGFREVVKTNALLFNADADERGIKPAPIPK